MWIIKNIQNIKEELTELVEAQGELERKEKALTKKKKTLANENDPRYNLTQ